MGVWQQAMPPFILKTIMNKIIMSFVLIINSLYMMAQPSQIITPITESAQKLFNFSQQDISYHNINYRLYIAEPKDKKIEKTPKPVLYMLDGNGQFPMLINEIEATNDSLPIIVGIGYPSLKAYPNERTRDYTIAIDEDANSGGAQNFYSFIINEVKPYIESNYNVDINRQSLCGHSYGGLFTLFVLFNHTEAFQNYIAASPSIWWGNGAIVPHRKPIFTNKPNSVTITLGEYEENPNADPERANLSPEILAKKNARIGGISPRQLSTKLSEEIPNCSFILYKGKNHGSSIKPFLIEATRIASQ